MRPFVPGILTSFAMMASNNCIKISKDDVDIFLVSAGTKPLIAAFCKDDSSEIFQEAVHLARTLVPSYDEVDVEDFHRWERRGKHTASLEQILSAMEPHHTDYFYYCVAAFEDPIQYSTVPLVIGAGWNQRQRQRAIALALALSANRSPPAWACRQFKELCQEVQVASEALIATKIKGYGVKGKGSSKGNSNMSQDIRNLDDGASYSSHSVTCPLASDPDVSPCAFSF